MKRTLINVLSVIFLIIYVGLVILGNVFVIKIPVAVVPGSYAEQFAKEKKLDFIKIADSEKYLLDVRYGTPAEEKDEDKTEKDSQEISYLELDMSDLEFQYNETETEIEIVRYSGNDKILAIPSHIKGKPVTKVSMDMAGRYDFIVFPETVTSITGRVSLLVYSKVFVVGLISVLLSFIVVLTFANILLPRFSKSEEFLLSSLQFGVSVLYLFLQVGFAILTTYRIIFLPSYIVIIADVILLGLYCMLMLMGKTGREHIKNVEAKVANETEVMKRLSRECQGLADSISDSEIKKQVARLIEDIKYSDKVSNKKSMEIEKTLEEEINKLKKAVSDGNAESIINITKQVKKTLDERNRIVKDSK